MVASNAPVLSGIPSASPAPHDWIVAFPADKESRNAAFFDLQPLNVALKTLAAEIQNTARYLRKMPLADPARLCPSDMRVVVGDHADSGFYRRPVNELGMTDFMMRDSAQQLIAPSDQRSCRRTLGPHWSRLRRA